MGTPHRQAGKARRGVEAADEPIISSIGDKVALGPLRRDLISLYQRWFSDLEVMRAFAGRGPRPTTFEALP